MNNKEMTQKIAIRFQNVRKQYRLGSIGGETLQDELQSWWARIHHKPDPNIPLDMPDHLVGKRLMALNGVNLTIYKGERVGIIGSNGAGKSTLLKLLCRVTAPTEGEIDLYGRVTSMLEVGTGFHGEMTGRENIYMNGAILGMSKEEIESKIEDIIEFSEVSDFIDTPVKRYSSGMFVKLAFSVAAHLNAEIMIMDEVLAVGDMAFQTKCLDRMRTAADEEGRTILYVSHNMNTIRRLCDRCIVLEKGKIIFDGDVEEAISLYMTRSLGNNEVEMDLSQKKHQEFLDENGIPIDTGLRMEHLSILERSIPQWENCWNFSSDNSFNEKDHIMHMLLRVTVTKPLSDIKFRMTFRTDNDTGVGTVWSDKFDLLEIGEKELDILFPLTSFAKGHLNISLGLYQVNEIGKVLRLDHITRAFRIKITAPDTWDTNAYGYTQLQGIKILVK